MRAIRNAKPVSIVAGSTLILEGCVGMWLAATAPAGPGNDKIVLLSFFYGAVALIWGVVILSWRFWSKPMVLIIMLALAQATVSVWRIIEQRQFSKVAVRLSNLQIN